jgi:hypothetical protein
MKKAAALPSFLVVMILLAGAVPVEAQEQAKKMDADRLPEPALRTSHDTGGIQGGSTRTRLGRGKTDRD